MVTSPMTVDSKVLTSKDVVLSTLGHVQEHQADMSA